MTGYVPYNERPHGGHSRLLELALATRPTDVLDAGCSSGYLARPLSEAGARVVGLELDPDAAERAPPWCAEVLVGNVESMALPFEPESFDVVLCGDLIEHLRDPGAALARLRPFLRPSGRLVLTTPNSRTGRSASRCSRAGGATPTAASSIGTHTHLFTRDTLVETVERAGLTGRRARPHCARAQRSGTHRRARRPYSPPGLRPSLFAYQFLLVADLGDLRRHPRQGRRGRSPPLPRRDRPPGGRRAGRGRGRRLGLEGRERRPRPGARCTSSTRSHRRSSATSSLGDLGVGLSLGELVVFTSQDAVADDEHWLAQLVAAARGAGRPRRRVRPSAPAHRRAPARAVLPRLPLWLQTAARAAPRAPRTS